MKSDSSPRLMAIGEYAAATQLTPKALRLYDEQALLRPARTDASSGYRYYSSAQVAVGRLIRTLREMDLSLGEIARIVAAPEGRAELLLSQLAQEIDHRYAREKRAFQTALMLMHKAPGRSEQTVEERVLPSMIVTVHSFDATRASFAERCRVEIAAAREFARRADLQPAGPVYCALIEPLSDEEGRLELLLAIEPPASAPPDATLRRIAAAHYAVARAYGDARLSAFTSELDVLFDWFDRRGCRAAGAPLVQAPESEHDAPMDILWAFETMDAMEHPP